jgi:hypothetical protein
MQVPIIEKFALMSALHDTLLVKTRNTQFWRIMHRIISGNVALSGLEILSLRLGKGNKHNKVQNHDGHGN